MLEFNGKQYAQTKAEFETLSAHGYYKVNRSARYPGRVSILILTPAKEPIALISPDGATVTAHKCASGIVYMYSTTKATKEFLGITELKYSVLCDMGRDAINAVKEPATKPFINDYRLSAADSARITCQCGKPATTGQNNGSAPFWYHCDACAEHCRQTGHFYRDCDYCKVIVENTGRVHCPIHAEVMA